MGSCGPLEIPECQNDRPTGHWKHSTGARRHGDGYKAQHSEDRSKFAGLFDRGQVVTNDPRKEVGDKLDPGKLDLRDPKVQRMLDIRPGPDDF